MNMLNRLRALKENQRVKKFLLYLLMPKNQARPRIWVKFFINPFIHNHGKGSLIRRRSRIDVLPFNKFLLGKNSTIEDFCTINNGVGDVIIGDRTRVGMGCVVIGPVEIGDDIMFAQNIVVSGLNHSFEDITKPISDQKVSTSKIIIENEVWIGANSIVTAGVTIGKHSVIGGGSVVTKNIPPYSVAVGNPAKIVKRYNFELKAWERI